MKGALRVVLHTNAVLSELVSSDHDPLVLRDQAGFEILDVNGLRRIVGVAG